ncbi:MAG: GH116 family glycosyl-hydrolase [bacterium]
MNNDQQKSQSGKTSCCGPGESCGSIDRRNFVKLAGIGTALLTGTHAKAALMQPEKSVEQDELLRMLFTGDYPVLTRYPLSHTPRIALPLGGIGTGTVSLGGRGNLRDWEIMNRSAKGFIPSRAEVAPFFAVYTRTADGTVDTRAVEGPVELTEYEASHGSRYPNENLPRFRNCAFAAAYPFGQVILSDPDVPVDVHIKAFNPFIPCNVEDSSIPVAVLRYRLKNKTGQTLRASVCGTIPNFIGMDGWEMQRNWQGNYEPVGARKNRNQFREGNGISGIFMDSSGIDPKAEQWGTMALATPSGEGITYRTDWISDRWGSSILDFWDDYSVDGTLTERDTSGHDMPIASLAVPLEIPAGESREVTFFITWHFPNRITWTPRGGEHADEDRIGNYYTTKYSDAWDVVEKTVPELERLEKETLKFVHAFCSSTIPDVVKEAALYNASTLRTQTCFRTPDGLFFGWEGLCDQKGCCHGSCTHVWNYEQATAFLYGELAMKMREVEFAHATNDEGLMSFRVSLPIERAAEWGKAAADGQMGCIMKMYRDWQLSGDSEKLKELYPKVKKALEFCWIPGGWDADQDGVMEGCQHNTMDVEYYGPNPQMGIWYLGALRAAEEMARYMEDQEFAEKCRTLFENGSKWIDQHLFNGEYYEHEVRPPKDQSEIAPSLLIGMGAKDFANPEFQLGKGCLVDQLVGQFMAHVCGLGYLTDRENVRKTLQAILKYNLRESLYDHFNNMRTFALGDESVLLMAAYPKERPQNPFSYFNEVMTGFEYTAAVGMLQEAMTEEGLQCIKNIRDRYDGLKRNPFNEAECGHHYARAMASWAAIPALTGFQYSAVDQTMTFTSNPGTYFWSNGYAWGTCRIENAEKPKVHLETLGGEVTLARIKLADVGEYRFPEATVLKAGEQVSVEII